MLYTIWYYGHYAIAVLAVVLSIRWQRKRVFRPPYPPGPKSLPLIGNIRDMPKSHDWLTYMQWSRQYNSSLIHLNLLGTHLVVVNSAEAAYELFDKRSAIYSDRPRMPMLTELVCWDMLSLYRYGDKWRTTRRMFHQYFNVNASTEYQPQETKAVHEFLYRLSCTPEDYLKHIRLMAGSLILKITYGLDIQSADDPYIALVEESVEAAVQAANPGSFLVDTLPFLKHVPEWVPGAGFKRKAREWRKVTTTAMEVPFQYVKDAMAKGVHTPSITSHALEQSKGNRETESVIRAVSAIAYVAGGETTASAVQTFFLAMVLYPDCVRRAQEELDVVVGQDRLPNFSDKLSLPYICAIVKEVLRWYPVLPLAIVHSLTEDDVFEGMFLPAGSLVIGNAWAILHDESVYKDPGTFNPDRFLKDGELDPDIRPPEVAAFGFGRRICPGRYLGFSSLFLNIACILATFDIGKDMDENGQPITPSKDFTTGLASHPLPFKCSIKPRSRQASNVISEAYAMHHPQI